MTDHTDAVRQNRCRRDICPRSTAKAVQVVSRIEPKLADDTAAAHSVSRCRVSWSIISGALLG